MSFFHVVASFKDRPEAGIICLFSDLTRKELTNVFIHPYRKGGNILNSLQHSYDLSQIGFLKIIETTSRSDKELRKLRSQINLVPVSEIGSKFSSSNTVRETDIILCGADVTEAYVGMSGPGSLKDKKSIWEHLAHIATIIAALIGLRSCL